MKKLLLTLLTLSSGLAYTAPARKPAKRPVAQAPVAQVAPAAPAPVAPAAPAAPAVDPLAQMLLDLQKALSAANPLKLRYDNIAVHISDTKTKITTALRPAAPTPTPATPTPENKAFMLKMIEALRLETLDIKAKYSESLGALAYVPACQSTEIKRLNTLLAELNNLEDLVTGITLGKIAKRYAMKPVKVALNNKIATALTLWALYRTSIAFPSILPNTASFLGKAGKFGLWLTLGYNANATTQPATAEVSGQ
ncbi:hypothetical protein KBD08_04105 [Candidatus Babeliales bacterium]|nr:hypothetical protein [Candidatus Babeliales bacterium]